MMHGGLTPCVNHDEGSPNNFPFATSLPQGDMIDVQGTKSPQIARGSAMNGSARQRPLQHWHKSDEISHASVGGNVTFNHSQC